MADKDYDYVISTAFPNAKISDDLRVEINDAALAKNLLRVETVGDNCKVWFDDTLSSGDKTALDGVVAAHAGTATKSIQEGIKQQILSDPLNGLLVTVTASGLVITADIEDLVDNDQTTIVADPTDTKFVKVCYVYNESTDAFSLEVYEKTTGQYAALAPPEVLVRDIKEFSVVANGTDLVEV